MNKRSCTVIWQITWSALGDNKVHPQPYAITKTNIAITQTQNEAHDHRHTQRQVAAIQNHTKLKACRLTYIRTQRHTNMNICSLINAEAHIERHGIFSVTIQKRIESKILSIKYLFSCLGKLLLNVLLYVFVLWHR